MDMAEKNKKESVTSDGSGTDSDPARFIKSDTVINTALYRYCRMRMKINTMPDDFNNWMGEFWWNHSGVTTGGEIRTILQ